VTTSFNNNPHPQSASRRARQAASLRSWQRRRAAVAETERKRRAHVSNAEPAAEPPVDKAARDPRFAELDRLIAAERLRERHRFMRETHADSAESGNA
jgi:hypothetical protein